MASLVRIKKLKRNNRQTVEKYARCSLSRDLLLLAIAGPLLVIAPAVLLPAVCSLPYPEGSFLANIANEINDAATREVWGVSRLLSQG
jgi:hypothetical protein